MLSLNFVLIKWSHTGINEVFIQSASSVLNNISSHMAAQWYAVIPTQVGLHRGLELQLVLKWLFYVKI